MELYGFGFNAHNVFTNPENPEAHPLPGYVLKPVPLFHAQHIDVLWASWCDAVIRYFPNNSPITNNTTPPVLHYAGQGLSQAQIDALKELAKPSPDDVSGENASISFFGQELGDSARGMIKRQTADALSSTITFFSNAGGTRRPEVQTFDVNYEKNDPCYKFVAITSALTCARGPMQLLKGKFVAQQNFTSVARFQDYLNKNLLPGEGCMAVEMTPSDDWKQLVSNAVSFTALTTDDRVFTWAVDRRFVRCLGREAGEHIESISPVKFLSETKVVKVDSGGYMTAALSDDGELFLWGQACPGSKGELRILKSAQHDADGSADLEEDDQDEWVKCVDIKLHRQSAKVTDVTVGSGHVLVAAELETESGVERAVFAAGQCEYGQLGIGEKRTFVEDFVEVTALRGKKVVSLAAAGWSSWVVVEQG